MSNNKSQNRGRGKSFQKKGNSKNQKNTMQLKNQYNRKTKKTNGLPVMFKPRSVSNIFSTSSRSFGDVFDCTIVIPSSLTSGVIATCPVHPLFYAGKQFAAALNSASFQIIAAQLNYSPIKGTDEGGQLVLGGTAHCLEIDNVNYFNQMIQIGANISPVWAPTSVIMPKDNNVYPINPCKKDDIPYTFIAQVGSNEGNHALAYFGSLYLHVVLRFIKSAIYTYTSVSVPVLFEFTVDGVKSATVYDHNIKMVVSSSTVPDIDIGEFVIIPILKLANTSYKVEVSHNGESISLYNTDNQYGTIIGSMFISD